MNPSVGAASAFTRRGASASLNDSLQLNFQDYHPDSGESSTPAPGLSRIFSARGWQFQPGLQPPKRALAEMETAPVLLRQIRHNGKS